jgi:CHASE2 domain-containing sensor protein/predicted Ser/Thr protein kinase
MPRARRKRRHIALFAAVAVIAAGLALLAQGTNALRSLELDSVDARFSIRGAEKQPGNIVVVAVDPQTINTLNRWPFPRHFHAALIDRLKAAGASLIVYDVQFTERTTDKEDNALIDSVANAGNVVLSTTEVGRGGSTKVFGGDAIVRQANAHVGNGELPLDSGGVIRRVAFETLGLKSLSVVAAEQVEHRTLTRSVLGGKDAWIDYRGPPGTIRTVSFISAYKGQIDPAFFRGKIVVIGVTAPSVQDVHPTSTTGSSLMSGAEVQANAIDTVLRGAPLRHSGGLIGVLLVLVLALFAPLISLRLKPIPALLASVAFGGLFAVIVQLVFNGGTILPFVYPVLALVLSVIGSLVVHYTTVESELRSLSEAIDRLIEKIGPGDTLGDYRVDELLARGGMGVVYRATQVSLDRKVALKVIIPELADDVNYRARFKREALAAASIDHPNVVPVYEAGEEGGLVFLAMRFIDGVDLRTLLKKEGPLPPARAAAIIAQVSAALSAAHARGLVHRDVKPANVLIDQSAGDHAYLTDFGLTRRTGSGSEMTQEGTMMGTLDYIPPEQINGQDVDARADVYALGCVLYELVTGRVPFERDSEVAKLFAHVSSEPPSAREHRPELSEQVDEVIRRAMAKRPQDRYPSAEEFARAATAALAQRGVEQAATGVEASTSPSSDSPAPTAVTTQQQPDD